MRYAAGVICFLLMISAAQATPWYYPDDTDRRVPYDGTFALTGAVIVGLDAPEDLPAHPDVRRVDWLTRQPAVARLVLADGADDLGVSQQLHDTAGVLWAHPDFLLPLAPTALPDDPYLAAQWHLEDDDGVDVNAEGAWDFTDGTGQLIAIVDSGVDDTHPDLIVTPGSDYVGGDSDPFPDDGNAHGTACAGLAAAAGDNGLGVAGVAYGAEVYGIRLIGGGTSTSDMYAAFAEATDAGASVISNSWGFTEIACSGYNINITFRRALEYPGEYGRGGLGTAMVFAAGNENCDISGDAMLDHEETFVVAAVSASDVKEGYSSYGDPIDIAAPSGGLVTTDITGDAGYSALDGDNDYTGGMSGTSGAAPIVSGTFALMFAANDRLTVADAREVVCQTATRIDPVGADYDETGWSRYYGCGRLDAAAAVAAVADSGPPAVAPSPTAPAEAYVAGARLSWEPVEDPDGDYLTYTVQWWTTDPGSPSEVAVHGLTLDLSDQVSEGDVVTWTVSASDRWGPGPSSDPTTLTIISPTTVTTTTEEPGGCQTVRGGGGGFGFGWLLLSGLWARRRYRSGSA